MRGLWVVVVSAVQPTLFGPVRPDPRLERRHPVNCPQDGRLCGGECDDTLRRLGVTINHRDGACLLVVGRDGRAT